MATTYGYGGEFSSDEDIDKLEQQSEQIIQSKFENFTSVKPSKRQIEETIEAIRRMPLEQDVTLSDELLAGLLDYYKTQRGPIVDSTRKLYKKIVLRLIRSDLKQAGNNDATNGNANNNTNLIGKRPQQAADSFSSDDEEPAPQILAGAAKRKFDTRVVHNNNNNKDDDDDNSQDEQENPMEVDSETPNGPVRETKQVDISTTEEDSEETSDESNESLNSESVLEVTPIKPQSNQTSSMNHEAQKTTVSTTQKQPESSTKRQQPIAHSTPKGTVESVKKPYTRSQRIAASRAAFNEKMAKVSSKTAPVATNVSNKTNRVSRRKYALLTVTLLVVILAFVLYYRSNLIKSTEPLFSRKITF